MLLSSVAVLMMAACGGGSEDTAPSPSAAPAAPPAAAGNATISGTVTHTGGEDPDVALQMSMPTNFPTTPAGGFSSPLGMAINQATYAGEKRRMMRHFDSEEGLDAFLSDVDLVSEALRDHIWTMSN